MTLSFQKCYTTLEVQVVSPRSWIKDLVFIFAIGDTNWTLTRSPPPTPTNNYCKYLNVYRPTTFVTIISTSTVHCIARVLTQMRHLEKKGDVYCQFKMSELKCIPVNMITVHSIHGCPHCCFKATCPIWATNLHSEIFSC